MVSTNRDRHRKPRTSRAEFECIRNVHASIRLSPSNIIRHSQFFSRTFEHTRPHSTEFESSRPTRIEFDDQGSLPTFIKTLFEYTSKPILGPTTLVESTRSSRTSRTTLEQHSISFKAILSYSAAALFIDNDCTCSPRCRGHMRFISLREQWEVSQY
jgi:hypothetical protein